MFRRNCLLALVCLFWALPAVAQLTTTEPENFLEWVRLRNRPTLYILIDLDRNELRLMDRHHVLWAAPVATGTGLRLVSGDREWEFSTPQGLFFVQRKERNPEWIRPDWYYFENGLEMPAEDSARIVRGQLGAAALYFETELAIHGTQKPELLGQSVSHGCIRLSNENILRLMHNVQVGTPIWIQGEANTHEPLPYRHSQYSRQLGADTAAAHLIPTPHLAAQLDLSLFLDARGADWVFVADALLERLSQGDQEALSALLQPKISDLRYGLQREYGTLLLSAYRRAPLEFLEQVHRMQAPRRTQILDHLVRSQMDQYVGDLSHQTAPWPSRAIPATGPLGAAELHAAEQRYRWLTRTSVRPF